jgi:glycerol-3-phosphate dehydrogenase
MDEPAAHPILKASSGIHIVLSARFAPPENGLLIPKTEDGRVLFILPWQGHALIGTTENPSDICDHPQAQEEEIEYLLRHINKYFDMGVNRGDVSSVWSGLRPLIQAQESTNTAQLVREHLIQVSSSGLLSMAGGKWTSYRKMAEEAVDQAIESFGFKSARACPTQTLLLVGAENFVQAGERALIQDYGLEDDVAHHLHHAFGDQASRVAELARSGLRARLHPAHPFIDAEVVYAVRHEFAERACDVLARRIPLALLDNAAAKAAVPRVVGLMASENSWDQGRCDKEVALCMQRLNVAI